MAREFKAAQIENKDILTSPKLSEALKNAKDVTPFNKGVFPLPNGGEVTFKGYALQEWTLSAGKDARGVNQDEKKGKTPVLVFGVGSNLVSVAIGAFSKPKTGWVDGEISYTCDPGEGLRHELASACDYASAIKVIDAYLKTTNKQKLVVKNTYVLSVDKTYTITVPNIVKVDK
jgi:hypothetical protein